MFDKSTTCLAFFLLFSPVLCSAQSGSCHVSGAPGLVTDPGLKSEDMLHVNVPAIFSPGHSWNGNMQPGAADIPRLDDPVSMDDLRYRRSIPNSSGSVATPFRRKAGLALLSSAVLPGSGQALNGKWARAGAYLLADALALSIHFVNLNEARKRQRRYEAFADQNWSVVNYAQWLVEYHELNEISNPHIDELRSQVMNETATFTRKDWEKVDLQVLQNVERNTPFVFPERTGRNFSHVTPEFGSQQYYELISKYYQFGPGWNDFGINRHGNTLDNQFRLQWNGADMPSHFLEGSELAESFNDHFRTAGNMISLLILNHIVSAFDAFITVKMNNKRIETSTNVFDSKTVTFRYKF